MVKKLGRSNVKVATIAPPAIIAAAARAQKTWLGKRDFLSFSLFLWGRWVMQPSQ